MFKTIIATCTLLVLSLTAMAQEQEAKLPGLEVGKKAPDFELQDQLGNPKKLSTMLKKGPVAIVFHRSAKW
jgi:cytochrome oxidase Cu insertion factor (SCO1/SenC/PrrC family)